MQYLWSTVQQIMPVHHLLLYSSQDMVDVPTPVLYIYLLTCLSFCSTQVIVCYSLRTGILSISLPCLLYILWCLVYTWWFLVLNKYLLKKMNDHRKLRRYQEEVSNFIQKKKLLPVPKSHLCHFSLPCFGCLSKCSWKAKPQTLETPA